MKSKYRIYVLLFFIACVGHLKTMEESLEMSENGSSEISEKMKEDWHYWCVYHTFCTLLKVKYYSNGAVHGILPFEVVGSKKTIAYVLRKRLDCVEIHDDVIRELSQIRNAAFEKLKLLPEENQYFIMHEDIQSIDVKKLLPFIKSLEEPIKKRLIAQGRGDEIAWRKGAYNWIDPRTNRCRNVEKCLNLDLEKEFAVEELRSKDYIDAF